MYKIVKNLLDKQDIDQIRTEIQQNLDLSFNSQQNYRDKIFQVKRREINGKRYFFYEASKWNFTILYR
jgi:hypothetical protein